MAEERTSRSFDALYPEAFDKLNDAVAVIDAEARFSTANAASVGLFGIPVDELLGQSLLDFVPRDRHVSLAERLDRCHAGEASVFQVEIARRDDTSRVASITIAPLRGAGGEFAGSLAIMRDVTEQSSAVQELAGAVERWKMLFELAPDGCFITDMKGTFIHGNRAAEELVGYPADELLGKSFLDLELLSTRDLARAAANLAKSALGRAVGPVEYTLNRRDGSRARVEIQSYPIKLDGRRCVFGIARDVSRRYETEEERTALEAQLAQAQKMEAIGRLAGGVAHDINNALGAIMGAASALAEEVETADQQADVQTILSACRKGSRLTRDLLGFARKGKYTKEIISLEEAIQRVVDLLKRTISKKIAIYTRLDDSLAPVEGDASQLENALMNVCINAADAMGGAGQLVIESSNMEIGERDGESWIELPPGEYVRLRVSDNGAGMDRETLERAFEPFYTTKPQGQGTGLGLSMVYGVIRNHGGSVLIDSAPGQGTTVTMILPVASEERISDGAEAAPAKPSEVPGEVGVLLVDDEPLVIRSTKRLLERLGYTVYTAVNGRDGLEVYESCRELIDVVVLDLLMPEMDGDETLRALLELHPEIKVVMATGFTEDSKIEELLDAGAKGFVEKPFDIEDLAAEMKRVIRGDPRSRTGKSSAPPD